MEHFLDERRPETCRSFGLDCHRCVGSSAANVAIVCLGMTQTGVARIFQELYPSPACAQMADAFQSHYFEATAPRKPMVHAIAAA